MSHDFDKDLMRPVVSVMQGIDVFFYSIEKKDSKKAWIVTNSGIEIVDGGFNIKK